MKIKTYKRTDNEGVWRQVSHREHDSPEWNEQDSVWINHIIKENVNYLTNEDVMYSKIDD